MKRPTGKQIRDMSVTFEGAKKASILKWQWICTATKKKLLSEWPICGFCVFYEKNCNVCILNRCEGYWGDNGWVDPLYEKIVIASDKLCNGDITLKQFRILAKRMLNRIKKTKER